MNTTIYQHDVESVVVKDPRYLDCATPCWSRAVEIKSKDGSVIVVTMFSDNPDATLPAFEINVSEVAA